MNPTLTDTGPLIALIDAADVHHAKAVQALRQLPQTPLLTTWSCWTEAMYLLGKAAGHPAREELWSYLADGLLQLYMPETGGWQRMRQLMTTYRDSPMDLADASLVAAAEATGSKKIFTFDRHFYSYRLADGGAIEVVP